jgi:hypothetical protein
VRMAAIVQSAQAATRAQDEMHQSKIGARPGCLITESLKHTNSRADSFTSWKFCNRS